MSDTLEGKLCDFITVCNDKSKQVKSTEYLPIGTIPIIDQSSSKIAGYTDNIQHAHTNILPAIIFGDHTRQVKYIDFPFAAGADGTQLIKSNDKIHPKFLYYKVCQAASSIGNYGYDRHLKHLKDFPFSIPADKKIQSDIANILSTVDNLIEQTEAAIAKYQSIKQGMMHDLFTRGVDANGHLRPPREEAPELYKESELGWIPKEWEVKQVHEIGSVRLGRQRSPKHTTGKHTTPYLRVANVFDGWIDYSDILAMDFTPEEKLTYNVLPGDIFLNEGQSLELVGRSAIYEGEPNRYCFQNTLIRFRAFPENDHRFCWLVFKNWLDTELFMTIARQTTSVAHLGADRFAKFPFARPTREEQMRISLRLDTVESKIQNTRQTKDKLQVLKSGLMQDLLSGRVRVPTADPSTTQEPHHAP
ncbi:restriction endonuclease subunit S [Solidesulfovibrio carbinolicus]|uniref:Type I restriction modification DNA specificity domain-containing protein n=1 Tax=Solidesulfovibrio carbinolicus TaxID=296842 RepID=A0A4P6HMR1_9BACT|nr:restriction endonuclease subunit S [Solidesulfovibrio carbinolicus]QAZ67270.1 hypothetical protein C3Y92_08525 [Solidesulfovibrio carbinolicus]